MESSRRSARTVPFIALGIAIVLVAAVVIAIVLRGAPLSQALVPAPTSSASRSPVPTASPTPDIPTVRVDYPKSGPLRLLVAGDSISLGGLASSPTLAYRQLVLTQLQEHGQVLMQSAGITGQGAAQIAAGVLATSYAQNLVIVEAGTNDVPGKAPELFRTNYEALLTTIQNRSPKAALLCLGPWADPVNGAPFDAVAEQVCEEHGGVYANLDQLWYPVTNRSTIDGFHPSDAGHAAIAEVVMQHLSFADDRDSAG